MLLLSEIFSISLYAVPTIVWEWVQIFSGNLLVSYGTELDDQLFWLHSYNPKQDVNTK